MKIFTKKGILQKTILVILTVLCINFIVPTYSQAGVISNIGGVLANALIDLTAAIGDAFTTFIQWSMLGRMADKEPITDSSIMVEEGDSKIKPGNGTANLEVKKDELDLGKNTDSDTYQVPVIDYSPEEIFSNKVPYLDINFISPKYTESEHGTAAILQETISGWYIALRNLSIVGLLCVLVYVGIRIIISSTAAEKAKHKQMFMDWLIALCLLFFLHYIMSFTLVIIDSINDAIAGSGAAAETVVVSVDDGTSFTTNVMGAARFMIQSKNNLVSFGYLAVYLALIVYTGIFTYHYLKRVLTMAFLTIIAPLVALTYPIDKIGDGKAQAFNMWLKEYVYTALIQPFHLIIYMIFVGSALELVQTNFIFGIAAIGFILPAEKLLKKMFGFDKAPLGAMGAIAGYTAGSLASKFGKSGGGSKGSSTSKGSNSNSSSKDDESPKYKKTHGTDGIDYKDEENDIGFKNDKNKKSDDSDDEENVAKNASEKFAEKQKEQEEQEKQKQLEQQQRQLEEQQMQLEEQNAQSQAQTESKEQSEGPKSMYHGKEDREQMLRGLNNIASAHGGKKAMAIKGAKTLGRAAKFTARAAMTGAGTIMGASAGLASGKGLAGVIAGATAGRTIGSNVGNMVANAPGKIIGTGINAANRVRTTTRRTIDTFNGNSNLQDKYDAKMFMKDAATDQYIRDKWTREHDGTAPTDKQVKEEKNSMKDYLDEGIYDVAEIYRAKKAESLGVSSGQSAKIAALAKDRKITAEELNDAKKYDARKADLTQEFMNKRGISQEEAGKQADYILNVRKAQVGQAHNLKRVETTPKGQNKTVQSPTRTIGDGVKKPTFKGNELNSKPKDPPKGKGRIKRT